MKKPKDCPLFLHGNGQWVKKIKGKLFYFGVDLKAALEKYAKEKDYLIAGLKPPTRTQDGNAVEELANLFYSHYSSLAGVGKVSQRHLDGCEATIKRLISHIGKGTRLEDLTPLDFAKIKLSLYKPADRKPLGHGGQVRTIKQRSVVTVDGDIRRILVFLNWCKNNKLVGSLDLGTDFKPSTRTELRKQRQGTKRKDLSSEIVLQVIEAATVQFRPLVLLGINAGIGNLDIADMKISELPNLDTKEVWMDLPRGKTGADRRFLLWPETIAAIRDYQAVRYRPNSKQDIDVLFLTGHGNRWVRMDDNKHVDAISSQFAKTRKELKLTRGTFYDLRRTFATVGMETKDVQAVKHVMGHIEGRTDVLAEIYVQGIGDDRIRTVCNHVRGWLFGGAK